MKINMRPEDDRKPRPVGPIGPFKKPTGRKRPQIDKAPGPVGGPRLDRREPGDGS